jgi:hypothetical protein
VFISQRGAARTQNLEKTNKLYNIWAGCDVGAYLVRSLSRQWTRGKTDVICVRCVCIYIRTDPGIGFPFFVFVFVLLDSAV